MNVKNCGRHSLAQWYNIGKAVFTRLMNDLFTKSGSNSSLFTQQNEMDDQYWLMA